MIFDVLIILHELIKCCSCSPDLMACGDEPLSGRYHQCPHALFSQDNDCNVFQWREPFCYIKADRSNLSVDSPPACSAFSSVELTKQRHPLLRQAKFLRVMLPSPRENIKMFSLCTAGRMVPPSVNSTLCILAGNPLPGVAHGTQVI